MVGQWTLSRSQWCKRDIWQWAAYWVSRFPLHRSWSVRFCYGNLNGEDTGRFLAWIPSYILINHLGSNFINPLVPFSPFTMLVYLFSKYLLVFVTFFNLIIRIRNALSVSTKICHETWHLFPWGRYEISKLFAVQY